jgi:HIRAN domain
VHLRDEKQLPWFQAVLVREPNNPYDENAIMVYSTAGHLGYLARDDAEDSQDVLEEVEAQGSQAGADKSNASSLRLKSCAPPWSRSASFSTSSRPVREQEDERRSR